MTVPDEALRRGLELAFVVAVLGARQRPPIPAPPSLRPYLRFQKLPSAALVPVRKAVEDDEAFRARVAAVAGEATVDRPAWLWLHHPDGWERELAELVDAAGEAEAVPAAIGPAGRRLEAAEAKLRKVSAELAVLRDEVARAQDGRMHAEAEATKARARQAELERAAERARQRAEQSVHDLAAARAEAEATSRELHVVQERAAELEDELAARETAAVPPSPMAAGPPPPGPELIAPPTPPADGGPGWPRRAQDALDGAAAAAAALAASLRDLASSVVGGDTAGSAPSPSAGPPPRPPARPAETVGPHPARRRALRVPRGMHLGTPEADAWLLTQAEAAVVVDGYNVAKLGWPDAILVDQRERLLDILEDLSARHGTTVEVVFDGADIGPVRTGKRRRVAVRFSPATVSADDVIRELVAGFPPTDPIVVVTNDRAVAHDVRAAGANVVSSDGLLAVARR